MYKLLWKIEELWKGSGVSQSYSLVHRYPERISLAYERFHYVDTFDPKPSQDIVFSDDYGEYYGLNRLQYMDVLGKPVYVFDNHNEMIFPLFELHDELEQAFYIVHIDAHPDNALFLGKKRKDIVFSEIGEVIQETRISDFFDAISETKILEDIQRVCDSESFFSFKKPEYPYILSLDIDIFGPEGDFIDLETKVRVIKEAWQGAFAVCIATSPGFINQDFAHEIVKIFTA